MQSVGSLAVSLLVGTMQCALNFGINDNTTYSVIEDTGLGPICYECDLMVTPNDCMQTVQCGRDEMCMLYELLGGFGGDKRFRTKCESITVCQSLQNHVKRSERVFCHNCCLENKCNNHCGETPTQPPAVTASTLTIATTTTTTATTTTTPTTTTAATTSTTPTTTTTPITTTRPTTTTTPTTTAPTTVYIPTTPSVQHRAPVCYQCNSMTDPSQCHRFVSCASGEVCIMHQTGQKLFNSGCIVQSVCTVIQMNTNQAEFCLTCCATDLCNNHCVIHHATRLPDTTTHAVTVHFTSHLPTHTLDTALIRNQCEQNWFVYIPYINFCVRLVNVQHSYNQAAIYCHQSGGMMAVIDSQGKYEILQSLLKYTDHFANTMVYIGAHSTSSHTFNWPNGKLVTGIWFNLNFNHPTADCIALDGSVGFTPKFVTCTHLYYFVCTKEF